MSDNLLLFASLCLFVWAIVRLGTARYKANHSQPTEIEIIKQYIPEGLLVLAGAVPDTNGGYTVTIGNVELWYVNGVWKRHIVDPMMRSHDKWVMVNENKVYALMEQVAYENLHQQQVAIQQPMRQVQMQSVHQQQLSQPMHQWGIRKDANGKRLPNVTVGQAEEWYRDNEFGWDYDPNSQGLWMPEPYIIRKDKQQNSPTFGKWIVDMRKP